MERKNVEKYIFVIYFVVEWQRIEEVVYFKLKEQTYFKCEYNSINYHFRLNDYFAEVYHITKYVYTPLSIPIDSSQLLWFIALASSYLFCYLFFYEHEITID